MKWVIGAMSVIAATAVGYQSLQAQAPSAPSAQVQIVTPCDNVDEGVCGRTVGCIWRPGYKVQGGQDVAGYCSPAPKSLQSRRGTGPAPDPARKP
jgi:hypothetical protein